MEKDRLLETLEQLRAELAASERVDPQTLRRFEQVSAEVEQALAEREDDSEEEPAQVSGLRKMLLKYEADHPELSASIGRVADALAAMGF